MAGWQSNDTPCPSLPPAGHALLLLPSDLEDIAVAQPLVSLCPDTYSEFDDVWNDLGLTFTHSHLSLPPAQAGIT